MPLMFRSNPKARKVIYSLLGKPAPFIEPKKNEKEQKMYDRVKSEYRRVLK